MNCPDRIAMNHHVWRKLYKSRLLWVFLVLIVIVVLITSIFGSAQKPGKLVGTIQGPRVYQLIRPDLEKCDNNIDVVLNPIEDFQKFETTAEMDKHCKHFEKRLSHLPALLCDERILKNIMDNDCDPKQKTGRIEIAIDLKHSSDSADIDENRFKIYYYNSSDETDFLEFKTNPKRLILKNIEYRLVGNLRIPVNIAQFIEIWKRSTFVDCLDINMKRDEEKTNITEAVNNLAMIRDEMVKSNLYPFLAAATMLGWYRECSIIPHNTVLELAFLDGELKQEYIDYLLAGKSRLIVNRVLGKLEDSFEMTVKLRNTSSSWTSVFVIYKTPKNDFDEVSKASYKSGFDNEGGEYRHYSLEYKNFCSAVLANRLFWVTCEAEEKAEVEYGGFWAREMPLSFYRNENPINTFPYLNHSSTPCSSYLKYYNFTQ